FLRQRVLGNDRRKQRAPHHGPLDFFLPVVSALALVAVIPDGNLCAFERLGNGHRMAPILARVTDEHGIGLDRRRRWRRLRLPLRVPARGELFDEGGCARLVYPSSFVEEAQAI